ncbi:hypothetical protein ACG7TL_007360 [Trametes sanguinea]
MREAIKGHRTACECANVLHRDASLGNIVIADDAPEGSHPGPFQGWNHSSTDRIDRASDGNATSLKDDGEENTPETIEEHKKRTGTFYFMAIALLRMLPGTLHGPCHDLESYYWVLTWVVLRHTDCYRVGHQVLGEEVRQSGDALCVDVFRASKDRYAINNKLGWLLDEQGLIVTGNKPLEILLRRFNNMVALSQTSAVDPVPRATLTHGAVIALFDETLAMEGWHGNDGKACTLLEKPRTTIAPTPIVVDVVPGYPVHSEGRALCSKTASKKALTAGFPMGASGSESMSGFHTPAQRSGIKRANEDDEPVPSGATQSRKRSKASAMAPPPAPGSGSGDAVAGPSGAATSGGRGQRSGSRAASGSRLSCQPSRRSSRIETQKEKKASGSDSAL